ncbi:MAG: beta-CASP ribonuclease aCPSF1 [Candidatus Hadarchaeales archaeon]
MKPKNSVEKSEVLEEIKKIVREESPFGSSVLDVDFEGPRVVLYCKDLTPIAQSGEAIKELAKRLRKRIILRPHPSLLVPKEEAEKIIREIVPPEAGVEGVVFSEDVGEVVIEAKKPGLAVGKDGAVLREIMHRIGWTPRIVRALPVESDLVKSIRLLMIQTGASRREILRHIGRRIYRGRKATEQWIRVTSLGGAREVGRSCLLLQTAESSIMIDCGINVASEEKAYPYVNAPELDLDNLDAVVISHAHLDHCGYLPILFKMGYDGPVYCTAPTRDLAVLLMLDFLEIAGREGKEMPYDKRDISKFLSHTIALEYGDVTDVSPDVRVTLHNAGHILGSAVVHFHIGDGLYNVVYTGDIKFDKTRLFSPAAYGFPRAETVIIESTYGGPQDIMPTREESEQEFIKTVLETIERGGKVLVPAFSVGRSQEIMVLLDEYVRRGVIHDIPIYLDGMIWEATTIHTAYPEYLSKELRDLIFKEEENPLISEIFTKVKDADARQEVIEGPPCVIISTSGMMTGGPVMDYFKKLAPDPRNTLVFVGYQAEGSLGRRIQKGWKEIPIIEEGKIKEIKVEMEVKTIEGFSGHSDRDQLLNYLKRITPKPTRVICVHGEESKCLAFASTVHKLFRVETRVPMNLETIRFY